LSANISYFEVLREKNLSGIRDTGKIIINGNHTDSIIFLARFTLFPLIVFLYKPGSFFGHFSPLGVGVQTNFSCYFLYRLFFHRDLFKIQFIYDIIAYLEN